MVRIRMQRTGRRNRPFYRIAVIDKRSRRDGRFIEHVGWYNPIDPDPAKQLSLDEERVKYWIGVGAQPSDTVKDFLAHRKLFDTTEWEAERKAERDLVEARKAAAAAAPAPEKKPA